MSTGTRSPPALETLQSSDLGIAHLPEQLQQQSVQLRRHQTIKILGCRHHARGPETARKGDPKNAAPPVVLPGLPTGRGGRRAEQGQDDDDRGGSKQIGTAAASQQIVGGTMPEPGWPPS